MAIAECLLVIVPPVGHQEHSRTHQQNRQSNGYGWLEVKESLEGLSSRHYRAWPPSCRLLSSRSGAELEFEGSHKF